MDSWLYNWDEGTSAALVSVLVESFCFSVYHAEDSHRILPDSPSRWRLPLGCIEQVRHAYLPPAGFPRLHKGGQQEVPQPEPEPDPATWHK